MLNAQKVEELFNMLPELVVLVPLNFLDIGHLTKQRVRCYQLETLTKMHTENKIACFLYYV